MYLNLASINSLSFQNTVSWPVSELEKEQLFAAIIEAGEDLIVEEQRYFQQQILRGILPTIATGCMNACYAGIVMDRLRIAGVQASHYRPSPVDYFSWQIQDGTLLEHRLLRNLLSRYLRSGRWLGQRIKQACRRDGHAVQITSNPTLETFLKDHEICVNQSHFSEWYWPIFTYSKRWTDTNFSQKIFDRLWVSVEQFRPSERVCVWLKKMVQENVSLTAEMLSFLFRSHRARETQMLYTATQGNPGTRLISLAVLENRGTVASFPHAGGLMLHMINGWMVEPLTTSCFYCYTPMEQHFRSREIPSRLEDAAEFRLLPQAEKFQKPSEEVGKIKSVLYLSGGYNGDRVYTGVLPETIRFDLELRIIDALIKNNVKVIVKLHRKSRSLYEQRELLKTHYGDRITIADTPLTDLIRQGIKVDAFVMENVKGGSLIEIIKTNKPVILFTPAMQFIQSDLLDSFYRRVHVIPCWYDERNRAIFNEDELGEYLNQDSRILHYEIVNQCTNTKFNY